MTDLVPLAKELELLERYIAIQRVRFGDRLRVTIDVPEDSRTALVPSLVLQPIVENSIKYGLAARLASGAIEVHACRRGDTLAIEVSDDGQGFSPAGMREGVGLGNTRARLAELYGPQQSFEVISQEGAGTRVRLTMPYQTAARGNAE